MAFRLRKLRKNNDAWVSGLLIWIPIFFIMCLGMINFFYYDVSLNTGVGIPDFLYDAGVQYAEDAVEALPDSGEFNVWNLISPQWYVKSLWNLVSGSVTAMYNFMGNMAGAVWNFMTLNIPIVNQLGELGIAIKVLCYLSMFLGIVDLIWIG